MKHEIVTSRDNPWCGYADAAAMLLSAFGERIAPGTIEALTGMCFGAFSTRRGLPYFSGLTAEPDIGISRALQILGFDFDEWAQAEGDDSDPFARLGAALGQSPAVVGPLDKAFLAYNPLRPQAEGTDHYVLAIAMTGNELLLHDSAGYSHVAIARPAFERAWRADAIGYKRGLYRFWSRPRRARTPTADEIERDALAFFVGLYDEAQERSNRLNRLIDEPAILALADSVAASGLTRQQVDHLTHLVLPMSAKRALDYVQFFTARQRRLRELKHEQAALFGRCQSQMTGEAWADAAATLRQLAPLETAIKAHIIRAAQA